MHTLSASAFTILEPRTKISHQPLALVLPLPNLVFNRSPDHFASTQTPHSRSPHGPRGRSVRALSRVPRQPELNFVSYNTEYGASFVSKMTFGEIHTCVKSGRLIHTPLILETIIRACCESSSLGSDSYRFGLAILLAVSLSRNRTLASVVCEVRIPVVSSLLYTPGTPDCPLFKYLH